MGKCKPGTRAKGVGWFCDQGQDTERVKSLCLLSGQQTGRQETNAPYSSIHVTLANLLPNSHVSGFHEDDHLS